MRNKKTILYIILVIGTCIVVSLLFGEIFKMRYSRKNNKEYKKLGLNINEYDIEYCTIYKDDILDGKYKVFKIKNYNTYIMEKIKSQLEESKLWNRNKYYEYIMKEFSDIKDDKKVLIDRDDLYYYNGKNAYAIFDLKNAKLYYYTNRLFNNHTDYNINIFISDFISREIYSVRGGPQGDGTDYYVYSFSKEKGTEIIEELEHNSKWSKNKLDKDILDSFKYNVEVLSIKNGYYYYQLVCRTRDEKNKVNITNENATGYEIGGYDLDKNVLYYYWTSN